MPTDLPVVPCYKSNNCGNTFQCGPTRCSVDDPECYRTVNGEQVFSGYSGSCWGPEQLTCDGVLSCCDPEVSDLNCLPDTYDPALTTNAFKIGCKIGDTSEEIGKCSASPGQTVDICMEFDNVYDTITPDCSEACWSTGGRSIINQMCMTKFPTEQLCNAMPYYCNWNGFFCVANESDPFDQYKNTYGVDPPSNPTTIPVQKECPPSSGTGLHCIQNPEIGNLNMEVTTSQSAWDSSKRTSYDPRTRIWCIKWCDEGGNCSKECLTTPRCQFVNDSCECSERDGIFMCGKQVFNKLITQGDQSTVLTGSGYCTWCTNQSETPQEIGGHEGVLEREPTEWFEDGDISKECNNRCSNYNLCEVQNTEELWNSCVYKHSPNDAVDPSRLEGLTMEEKQILLRQEGFCYNTDNITHKSLVQKCEEELQYLGSISGGETTVPGQTITPGCTYQYEWTHVCQTGIQTAPQWSENYLCTWCPSLQCKKGRKEDICNDSRLTGSNKPCTTNEEHGAIINPEKWEPHCGCYGETIEETIIDKEFPAIVGGSAAGSVVAGLAIAASVIL